MELVQKLIKKTSKYLFYSPLTEKVLTECPCTMGDTGLYYEGHEGNVKL